MNWHLDVFAEDENPSIPIHAMEEMQYQQALREGPCEDDCEMTCPFIGLLPQESGKEEGSPLNFKSWVEIDQQIELALKLGI